MAKEIERKFLVRSDEWRSLAEPTRYRQGYLSSVKERVVRVRTIGDRGFLTIKGITKDVSRLEFEYDVPLDDAGALLELCEEPIIEKDRSKISVGDLVWEVDEFFGDNAGLIVAEVELEDADQAFDKPAWVGEEVSGDPRYFNSNLIKKPYTSW